jgi:molecular chaperone Hsp33
MPRALRLHRKFCMLMDHGVGRIAPSRPGMAPDRSRFLSYFDRDHDVLLSVGDPRAIHRDLELHLLAIGVEHDAETLQLLKDGLAALALYMVSRPRFEAFGWTFSFQEPPLNLFFTGSVDDGKIVGRAFRDNVKEADKDLLFVQTIRPRMEPQTSTVELAARDVLKAVEHYCAKSDQQLVRFFHAPDQRVAFLSSLPDADRAWLEAVEPAAVFDLERTGNLKLIAEQVVAFRCTCDASKILNVVLEIFRDAAEDLFRGESFVEAECPRCGAQHRISREDFERARQRSA